MNQDWAAQFVKDLTNDLDAAMAYFHDDINWSDMCLPHHVSGKVALRELFRMGLEGPDSGKHQMTAHRYIGDVDGGVVEWTWRAEHIAPFMGADAAGKSTECKGASVLVFQNGKIVEQRDYWDAPSVLRQLGVFK